MVVGSGMLTREGPPEGPVDLSVDVVAVGLAEALVMI